MSDKSQLEWFRARRESRALALAREHMAKVADAASDLDGLLDAAVRGRAEDIASAFRRLVTDEKAADSVEMRLVEEATRGELPPKDREDLLRLATSADMIVDWLKVSGKNVELLQETGVTIPAEVWSSFKEMTKNTLDCAMAVKRMLDAFGANYEAMVKIHGEIRRLEHVVDDLYFENRKILVRLYASPGVVVILNDLLEGIENATDNCKNASDTLLSLALKGR